MSELDIDTSTLTPAGDTPIPSAPSVDSDIPNTPLDKVISETLAKFDDDEPGPADDADEPASGRTRDERGRFIAKETAPTDEAGTEPDASVEPEEPETAQPDAPSEGHFRGWSKEQREEFAKLSPEAQRFALDLSGKMQGNVTRVSQEFSDYQKAVDPYLDVFRQHSDYFEQVGSGLNLPPMQIVANLIQTENTLRSGTYAEKVALFRSLANDYGIPVTVADQDVMADPAQPAGEAYPIIHDLKAHIQRLEGQLTSYQRQQEASAASATQAALADFASAKDAQGNTLHPHFDAVRGAMGQLIKSGSAKTLEDAYRQAVAPIMAAAKAEQERIRKANEAAVAKASRVRPVKTSGNAPGGATRATSLDDIIGSALSSAGFS